MMREIDIIKEEITLNRRAKEMQKRVFLAEVAKELEMLDKFEIWITNVEGKIGLEIANSQEV